MAVLPKVHPAFGYPDPKEIAVFNEADQAIQKRGPHDPPGHTKRIHISDLRVYRPRNLADFPSGPPPPAVHYARNCIRPPWGHQASDADLQLAVQCGYPACGAVRISSLGAVMSDGTAEGEPVRGIHYLAVSLRCRMNSVEIMVHHLPP
jgi:hypothetical protein